MVKNILLFLFGLVLLTIVGLAGFQTGQDIAGTKHAAEYDRGLKDGHAWALRELNNLGMQIAKYKDNLSSCTETLEHVMRHCGGEHGEENSNSNSNNNGCS